jgi:hypothetical protein
MLKFITFNTGAEIICLIIALMCLIKDKSLAWRNMILFLLLTCITEISGIYVRKLYLIDRAHVHPNVWLYNILLVFQMGFTNLMFNHLLSKYSNSKPFIISGLALLVIFYAYETVSHGIFVYNNLTNIVMGVMFILYSLYFYYHLINDDKYFNLAFLPSFWWVAGVLFSNFGRTACNLFYGKLASIMITSKHNLTFYIYIVLNIILYSCWSYSFICRKWETRKLEILS